MGTVVNGLSRKKFAVITVAAVVVCLACLLIVMAGPPREPVWRGYRLSEWLVAYDAGGPFDPQFLNETDAPIQATSVEIEEALEGIGQGALPCLRYWLTARPGRVARLINRALDHQYWIKFRFADDYRYRLLARTGFEAYNSLAQPLLPDLIELTESPDTDTRMWAFQAAFFTEPEKEVFMRLFERTTASSNLLSHQLARHWMLQRFPGEAKKAGIQPAWANPVIELPLTAPFGEPALTNEGGSIGNGPG